MTKQRKTISKMAFLAVNAMVASCAITIAWAKPATGNEDQLKEAINQQPPALDIAMGAEIPSEG